MIISSFRRRAPSWLPLVPTATTRCLSTDIPGPPGNLDATPLLDVASTTPLPDDLGTFLTAGMSAVDGLHSVTGLPWWGTLVAGSVLLRTAMLPISLKGMKASAALFPLLREARKPVDSAVERKLELSGPTLEGGQEAGTTTATPPEEEQVAKLDTATIARRFHELRTRAGAPHPAWILVSPLVQLPAFVLAMSSVRSMCLTGWPGFSSGGVAWFPDLTAPALDVTNLTAPLGSIGIVLPLTIALAMHANIQSAFGVSAGAREQSPTLVWVLGNVKLLLEWALVPLFAIALQLPHGAVCYWATSSVYALAQNQALKLPAVRQRLGLTPRREQTQPLSAERTAVTTDPSTNTGDGSESATAAAFQEAASLHAAGNSAAAAAVLESILTISPDNPRAHFALGQVLAALKDWSGSEQHYAKAAALETGNKHQRARSWFGAAVAMHMGRRHERAIKAFGRAARDAGSDDLRVRCWVSQATLQQKLGRRGDAVKALKKAATLEPKVKALYLQPLLDKINDKQ